MTQYSYLPSWDNAWRVAQTKDFLRSSNLLYHEVEARVVGHTENAFRCRDRDGVEHVLFKTDCSFASLHIAEQNSDGRWLVLKIRKWT